MTNYSEEQIKKWILTDYMDGCLPEDKKKIVVEYISNNPHIKEFADTARKMCVQSFDKAERSAVPPRVWSNIREEIEKSQQPDVRPSWVEQALGLFKQPRVAVVGFMTTVVLIVVLGIGLRYSNKVPSPQAQEQIDYLVILFNGDEESSEDMIENYFM